jgi:hypothetical protein
MHWTDRFVDGPALRKAIRTEVELLSADYPYGFLIRLHGLGDFPSTDYVRFWSDLLTDFPALHLWGFTARLPGTHIGNAVQKMIRCHGWSRCALRLSGLDGPKRCSKTIAKTNTATIDTFTVCPVELGRLPNCASCGICWRSQKSIAFIEH